MSGWLRQQAVGFLVAVALPVLCACGPLESFLVGGAGTMDGQGNADVLDVQAIENADGTWTFYVTVAHPDTGWEDYADGWDVVTPEGVVLKPDAYSPYTRLLLHPHETEQPFTRSQNNIMIPEGATSVRVRAHDLVNGYGGQEIAVDLTADAGPGFSVKHWQQG